MVDALVLEASTSVCGFESHLPHQKKRAPKGAFFFWCQGIRHSQMPPAAAGTSASLHVWQEPAVPHTRPSLFCDTIQFAIETDRSCHRQRPGAELRSGLFSLPPICAPVPADPNLPGSKKAPERVPSFGLYHRLPQDSPSRIHAAERHTKALHSSLFSLPSPHSGLPLPLPGRARELPSRGRRISSPAAIRDCKTPFPPRTAPHAGHRLILNPCRRAALRNYSLFSILSSLAPLRPSPPTPRESQRAAQQGAEDQFPGSNTGLQNALSPPHSPACRAQAHSEPVPQSGTPKLFTLHSSLFTLPALPLFPSGTDSKTKIYFVFFT